MRIALALLLCICGTLAPALAEDIAIPLRRSPGGHLVVPVEVNGQGPYAFVVDTAASRTVISQALASALSLPPMQDRIGKLAGAGGVSLTAVFQLGSLRFAGHDWELGPALAMPENGAPPDFAGVLGLDILARQVLLFDFSAHTLHLLGPDEAKAMRHGGGWVKILARRNFAGFLVVTARVGGKRVKAVIDTGARRSIGNTDFGALLDNLSPASTMAPSQIVTGVNLPVIPARTGLARKIAIRRLRWHDAQILVSDLAVFKTLGLDKGPALILGLDFFQNTAAVMIDFSRQRLWIRPFSGDNGFRSKTHSH